MVPEGGEWRRQDGPGGCLRRRFQESRLELERVLGAAQDCLADPGDPEEVLRRHNVREHGRSGATRAHTTVQGPQGATRGHHYTRPSRSHKMDGNYKALS